jgi:ADP-ribose pyrophosphatase YjhB (NUDIX family)
MADLANNQTHILLINAVVVKNGKILIGQRSYEESHEPGRWSIPGGKVDRTNGGVDNIVEETLKREIHEETGVEIDDEVKLIGNNTFIRSTGHHVVVLTFLCNWKSGEAKPLEDTIGIKWLAKEEVGQYDFSNGVLKYIDLVFDSL